MLVFRIIRKLDFLPSQNWRNVSDFTPFLPLYTYSSSLSTIKPFVSAAEDQVLDKDGKEDQSLFTVSYLVNSCGFSPQLAKSTLKKLKFDSSERPDCLLNFLKNQGFTHVEVSRILKRMPRLLLADPENVLLPKFQFLRSKGASTTDLAIIFNNSNLLERSLDKHIIPCYDALKQILLDDDKVLKTLKRASWFFTHQIETNVAQNVSVLRKLGVPHSLLSYFITTYPQVVSQNDDKFDHGVKKVIKLGFDPLKTSFVEAIVVISGMSEETIKLKMEVYKRWGLSEDFVWSAFKRKPMCFRYSEEKIMKTMDYLVNKMHYQAEDIVPNMLGYSLEKRIIPRCNVIEALRSNGLLKDEFGLYALMVYTDVKFLTRFVVKHKDKVPRLLDDFHGKMSLEL